MMWEASEKDLFAGAGAAERRPVGPRDVSGELTVEDLDQDRSRTSTRTGPCARARLTSTSARSASARTCACSSRPLATAASRSTT